MPYQSKRAPQPMARTPDLFPPDNPNLDQMPPQVQQVIALIRTPTWIK